MIEASNGRQTNVFDFKRAYQSALSTHPDDSITPLSTPWGAELDPHAVLQEHPRPQMRRKSYINLNGIWEYAITQSDAMPDAFDGNILVPFSPEASLSGVSRTVQPEDVLWYRRNFDCPRRGQGMRVLLHFEAVDYAMTCWVNDVLCGTHEGGYLPFSFDITDALTAGSDRASQMVVAVRDPSEQGMQPRGKQRLDRGSIWCSAQSGIWQTVWMEVVPAAHVTSLTVDAHPDESCAVVTVHASAAAAVQVVLRDEGDTVARAACPADAVAAGAVQLHIPVSDPHLWSPDDPHLYELEVSLGSDVVYGYCAFRTFTVERDARGVKRFCCNHQPLFLKGVLDQGYWSDGLMTAPSDEALVFDIKTARSLGFTMLRKHLKVESDRYYYHCDRLGMVVWQDMVNGGGAYPARYSSYRPTLAPLVARLTRDTHGYERFGSDDADYRRRWMEHSLSIVEHLRNHPCIGTWVIFNEGWGQFNAADAVRAFRQADPSRPLDQASGWFDQGGGDYKSEHNYFRTLKVPGFARRRAAVISEFGGVALRVDGHSAIQRAYGYATCQSADELQSQLDPLFAHVNDLQERGLSGYVYTQLTDVEEEVNGLITYDRRVVKVSRVCG